jgi:hypothetical protein
MTACQDLSLTAEAKHRFARLQVDEAMHCGRLRRVSVWIAVASGFGALAGVIFGEIFRILQDGRNERRALGREHRSAQRTPYGQIMAVSESLHREIVTSPAVRYLVEDPESDGHEWDTVHATLRSNYELIRYKGFTEASDEVLGLVLRLSPILNALRKATSRFPLDEEMTPDQSGLLNNARGIDEVRVLREQMGLTRRKSNQEMLDAGNVALLDLRRAIDAVREQARIELKLSSGSDARAEPIRWRHRGLAMSVRRYLNELTRSD